VQLAVRSGWNVDPATARHIVQRLSELVQHSNNRIALAAAETLLVVERVQAGTMPPRRRSPALPLRADGNGQVSMLGP
jgi:hypothetical protein